MEFKSPAIHRTPLYRAKASFANMKRRCRNGKDTENNPTYQTVELRMTLEEWLVWAVPQYEEFLQNNPDLRPCAARLGDVGHYEIGNIKIISVNENIKEGRGTRGKKIKPFSATHLARLKVSAQRVAREREQGLRDRYGRWVGDAIGSVPDF